MLRAGRAVFTVAFRLPRRDESDAGAVFDLGMRPLLLGSLVLLALSVSAGTPISPVPPVYGGQSNPDVDPSAATNGTSTLVAWTNRNSVYAETWLACWRLVGVQSESSCLAGLHPQVATDGADYLLVRTIASSRFAQYPYDNVAADVIRPDGTRGATRVLNNSVHGSATAAAWDGREWIVALVADGEARLVFLDRDLIDTRAPLALGPANSVILFEGDGEWWTVRVHDDQSEISLVGGSTTYPVDGVVTIAGPIAFIANGSEIRTALFDPRNGFGEPHAAFTSSSLVATQPYGDGARAVVQSGTHVLGVVIDAAGNVTQTTPLYTTSGGATAALVNDTLYFSSPAAESDIYAAPALAPVDLAPTTLISVVDEIVQTDPMIVSDGDSAVVLWTEIDGRDHSMKTIARDVDGAGAPSGEHRTLPYRVATADADGVLRDGQLIVVWSDGIDVHAGIGDEDILLGKGSHPAIASSADDAFVVWLGADGLVRGTPLDARVPNGFAILASFTPQSAPAITAVDGGFLVLWSTGELQSVVISPSGAVRSATPIGPAPLPLFVEGRLAAWTGSLLAYAPAGQPFERFDPHWPWGWAPIAIAPLTADANVVFLRHNDSVYASTVTMDGAFITGITPLDYLGRFTNLNEDSVALLNGKPVVVARNGQRVEITTTSTAKARPARRAR